MNLRAIVWLLGCVALLMAAFLALPALLALALGDAQSARAFALSSAGSAAVGALLWWRFRGSIRTRDGRVDFHRREGLATVGLVWLVCTALGALPFVVSGFMRSPVDALFESASGFTTTGASILSPARIDQLPAALAFWRALTHWVGGIGIVLVFVVLFPVGGRSLFRSEVVGVSREASLQRVRDSALAVVRVYVALTVLHVVALLFAGVSLLDAVMHAFSSLATGGFSNHGASVAWFSSWAVEAIIIVFMIAAGMNFSLWDAVVRLGPRRAWALARANSELWLYLGLIAGATLFCTLVLWLWGGSNGDPASNLPDYSHILTAFRDASFSVSSIQTCTGYATADFDRWPDACRFALMLCVFFGACTGSTGGGIKILRVAILAKAALAAVLGFSRPRALHPVRVDGAVLGDDVVAASTRYFALWILVALGGALCLATLGSDLETALSAAVVCLNNCGPGLASVGPAADYGHLPDLSKLLLAFLMIAGRLEFYAVAVLFVPGFWRR